MQCIVNASKLTPPRFHSGMPSLLFVFERITSSTACALTHIKNESLFGQVVWVKAEMAREFDRRMDSEQWVRGSVEVRGETVRKE